MRFRRVAGLFGLLPYDKDTAMRLDRQNLMMAMPMVLVAAVVSVIQITRLVSGNSNAVPAEYPRAYFLYSLTIAASVLLFGAMVAAWNNRLRSHRIIASIIYVFMYANLCFGFQMATEQDDFLFVFNTFYVVAMWTFLMLNSRPIVTFALTILFNIYLARWGREIFDAQDHRIIVLLVLAMWVVSFVRYNFSLRQVKLEGKAVRLSRELHRKNRQLQSLNKELRKLSSVDALTGVRNRHALRADFSDLIGQELHVMICDIDNFKSFNDQYGHEVGDMILSCFGQAMRESFAGTNCYRYGGDEFLVISSIPGDTFPKRIELLQELFANLVKMEHREVPTLSAGFVYGDCRNAAQLREMFAQADAVLYEAKKAGRNNAGGVPYEPGKFKSSKTKTARLLGTEDVERMS